MNNKINTIFASLDHIRSLVHTVEETYNKARLDNQTNYNINIKLDILNDNLESILDNLSDINLDMENNCSELSEETKELYRSRSKIKDICVELFPTIMTHILNKNINDQVVHEDHEVPLVQRDLSYF